MWLQDRIYFNGSKSAQSAVLLVVGFQAGLASGWSTPELKPRGRGLEGTKAGGWADIVGGRAFGNDLFGPFDAGLARKGGVAFGVNEIL
jgi:hypothetical protein